MNLSTKQKQRTDLCLPRESGVGKGLIRRLGLADANYYIQKGLTTRSYCILLGTTFNIL